MYNPDYDFSLWSRTVATLCKQNDYKLALWMVARLYTIGKISFSDMARLLCIAESNAFWTASFVDGI